MNQTLPHDHTRTSSATPIPVTIARGDGIGPEIMAATLQVLDAAGARLQLDEIEIGEKVYLRGAPAGIEPGRGSRCAAPACSSRRRSPRRAAAATRA